ncbi:SurA N-terminal domain-containing protein [Marinospirillum sp.]|uniref:SurA N-terminal domain-containing protein n=1 Tax=Marinospirillum sp. TaxID=2183934 RepID=UPI002870613F|nr:SurA N-terminal domain-containing protein [Marinospirillum sp.]MDR9468534.1 SurA N-terminal domain-containing protein [Marinospirillum sp.]
MLVKIREKSKGIVAYFIVGLIALAFSMWGMDSLFTALRGDPNELAKVNGESISQMQVDRYAQQQMRQLMQSGQVDPDQIDMNQLRQFALSQLVQEELLRQEAKNLNMRIPDGLIEREMVQFDAFMGEDGRFDREIFTQRLRQQGMSATDFRSQLREDLLNQQLLGGLAASEFVLTPELQEFQQLVGQQRDYRYVKINAGDYRDQVEISPADIEAFYEQESERFMTPERVRVDYLIFDPSELAETLEVTEEELQEEYQRFVETQEGESNYSAAHILLTFDNAAEEQQARETLQEARQEIQDGASFAELARELSEDAATARRGGDLGAIQQGSLDSAFEEALFALDEVGDLSGVVETDFGLHLIQLTDLEEAEVAAYEEVKEELRERLLAQPLRAATSDMLEQLNNLSFSSDDLSQVASATELEMQTSDWLNAGDLEGFWAEPEVSAELFSEDIIEDDWITEPLRLEDGRYLVLAKNEYQPRQPQPLEEVTAEVRNELAAQEARQLAQEEANRLQEELLEGTELDADWENVEGVSRNQRSVDSAINQAAFALNLEAEPAVRTVTLRSGDVALVQLLAIEPGEVSESEDEIRQLRRMLIEDQGRRLQSEFVNHLEQQAEIDMRQ